jgi:hypothetical protein
MDSGFGDAVTPAPVEASYPTLLDMSAPWILAYPCETVVAEKLEAIVDLGMANSRMNDYFDVWYIATTFQGDPLALATAVRRPFARRRQPLPEAMPVGVGDEFAASPIKRLQWAAFIRQRIGDAPSLQSVVAAVREFAIPSIKAAQGLAGE